MTSPTLPCSELPRVLERTNVVDLPLATSPEDPTYRMAEGGENDLTDVAELGAVRTDCLQVV